MQVLPPKKLLHPVLPFRCHGKLTFPPCKTCIEQQSKRTCRHTVEKRSFWGSWVTLELDEALKQGYQVLEISEVWDYKNHVKYDGKSAESGLFTRYINSFLKLKVEASGWPSWVKSEEDREKFMSEYEEREGIRLDEANMEMNKTLRQVAKLCLNSFWGKFG